MRSQTLRTVTGRANSDGSIAAGAGEFSVQRISAGNYVVRFPRGKLLGLTASPATNSAAIGFHVSQWTDNSAVVAFFTVGATPAVTDYPFVFTATLGA